MPKQKIVSAWADPNSTDVFAAYSAEDEAEFKSYGFKPAIDLGGGSYLSPYDEKGVAEAIEYGLYTPRLPDEVVEQTRYKPRGEELIDGLTPETHRRQQKGKAADLFLLETAEDITDLVQGAARGVTVGVSDMIAPKVAGIMSAEIEAVTGEGPLLDRLKKGYTEGSEATQEYLRESREGSPWLSLAGEVAGTLGTTALTGGTNILATGAIKGAPVVASKVATLGKGGLAALGRSATGQVAPKAAAAAQEATKAALRETAKRAADGIVKNGFRKSAGFAAEGAADAAQFSFMNELSNMALQDEYDFTPSNIAVDVGIGALFGIGVGGLGAVARRLKNASVERSTAKRAASIIDENIAEGEKRVADRVESINKINASIPEEGVTSVLPADDMYWLEVETDKLRALAQDDMMLYPEKYEEIVSAYAEDVRKLERSWGLEGGLVEDIVAARKATDDALGELRPAIRGLKTDLMATEQGLVPAKYLSETTVDPRTSYRRQLSKYAKDPAVGEATGLTSTKIEAAGASSPLSQKDMSNLFRYEDDLLTAEQIARIEDLRLNPGKASPDELDVLRSNLVMSLRMHNPKLAAEEAKSALSALEKKLATTEPKAKFPLNREKDAATKRLEFNEGLQRHLYTSDGTVSNDKLVKLLSDVGEGHLKDSVVKVVSGAMRTQSDDLSRHLLNTLEFMAVRNLATRPAASASGKGMEAMVAAMRLATRGPVSSAIGLINPMKGRVLGADMVRDIAKMKAKGSRHNVIGSIAGALHNMTIGSSLPYTVAATKEQYVQKRYAQYLDEKSVEQIRHLRSNPSEALKILETSTRNAGEDAKPGLVAKSMTALEFLGSKLPKNATPAWDAPLKERKLSASERRKLNNYYRYTFDFKTILDDFSKGVIKPEAVEALRVVWPEYESLMKRALDLYFSTHKPSLRERRILGNLLGSSVDTLKVQNTYNMEPEEGEEKPERKEKAPSAKQVKDSVKVNMTDIHRVSEGLPNK